MKKSVGLRTKAMLLAAAMLVSMTFSSCTALMKEVSMETSSARNGALIPVVTGFLSNSSVNDKLQDEFMPLAVRMKAIADESEGRLEIEYGMAELKKSLFGGEYAVTMYLSDQNDNIIELKTVTISGIDSVKPEGEDKTQWLDSAIIAESALLMQSLGIEFDTDTLGESSTEKNAVETFIRLYESIVGREVDISEAVVAEDDPVTQKALVLGFNEYYSSYDYQYDNYAYIYRITGLAEKTLTAIERDAFGRQSESVTGDEFAGMLTAFHGVMRVPDIEGSDKLWSELGKVDTDAIISSMDAADKPFTRRDAAEFLEKITRNGPKYSMKYGDSNLQHVEDATESIWVRRAVTHGFMNYYGDSTMFAPWEGLTVVNAIESAKCYMNVRYNDWANSVNYAWDSTYTNADVIIAAAYTAGYFDDRSEQEREFTVKTVINDRDYNWFFSQKNTGEYSSINCMPSIATMASHWYNRKSKATVRKMRATSSYEDGWTAFQLRNGLSAYDVPYTVVDATLENITQALDSGSIVLAQYSDRPFGVSGHCYVIYGYRSFKDSTTFIVNDSDSLTNRSEIFGRAAGQGNEVEGSFAMWSISRFVDDVTVISSDRDN